MTTMIDLQSTSMSQSFDIKKHVQHTFNRLQQITPNTIITTDILKELRYIACQSCLYMYVMLFVWDPGFISRLMLLTIAISATYVYHRYS